MYQDLGYKRFRQNGVITSGRNNPEPIKSGPMQRVAYSGTSS